MHLQLHDCIWRAVREPTDRRRIKFREHRGVHLPETLNLPAALWHCVGIVECKGPADLAVPSCKHRTCLHLGMLTLSATCVALDDGQSSV